jgi:hypothetical protein
MENEATSMRKACRAWRPFAGAVLALATMIGMLPSAQAGWDGNIDIQLGETFSAEFVKTPPGTELHRFYFYAPAGTILGATWRTTFGPLETTVGLFKGDGSAVALGTSLSLPTKTIKNLRLTESDEYYLQVKSVKGVGEYSIKTTASFPGKIGPVTKTAVATALPKVATSISFSAIAGASLSATVVKTPKSLAVPSFVSLLGRYGLVTLPLPKVVKAGAKAVVPGSVLTKLVLPYSGDYTLSIGNAGVAGDVTISGTITSPAVRRVWYLGPIDPPSAATLNAALWQGSGHGDARAMPFIDWDYTAAAVVPQNCARCHSSYGFQDFIGADGTPDNRFDHPAAVSGVFPPAMADAPAKLGSTVDCNACHNPKAAELDAVVFPSDRPAAPAVAMDLGSEARCMQCHQGRESTVSLDEYIAFKAPATDDTVVATMSFKNVHYVSAGATLYGGGAKGAYQYGNGLGFDDAGKRFYDGLNPHVAGANTCVQCHDPHSLQVKVEDLCSKCHGRYAFDPNTGARTFVPVTEKEDLKNIRMVGSTADYDGDGNVTEGMYYELSDMAAVLLTAIQTYATTVVDPPAPIAYDAAAYPYFSKAGGGTYASWTARLLRAAYNYNYYIKEPGNYAHNPKYIVQVLYDSIADLASVVEVPKFRDALGNILMQRSDPGHFMGESMAYRDWDVRTYYYQNPAPGATTAISVVVDATNDIVRGDVSTSCSPCHSNGGFEFRQKNELNTTVDMSAADGMECGTCHVGGVDSNGKHEFGKAVPAVKFVKTVVFPSLVEAPTTITNGTTLMYGTRAVFVPGTDTSFVCMSCHRGRESMATLDAKLAPLVAAGNKDMTTSNVHYLPAGATLYGKDAKVAYMFRPSTTYSGKWAHNGGASAQCKYCHVQGKTPIEMMTAGTADTSHTFKARFSSNCLCHSEVLDSDIETFGIQVFRTIDYDGVPRNTLKAEVDSFAVALLAQINTFRLAANLTEIVFTDGSFRQASGSTSTVTWGRDPNLVRAAFNYNYYQKEPGAWAHNTRFIMQVLYDSIDILDGGGLDNSPTTNRGLIRPSAAK